MGLMCGSARWERARAYVPFPASMRLMYVSARWGRTLTYVPPIPVSTSMVYVWQHPAGPNTIDVPVPPPVGGGAWWRPAAAKIYWRPPPSVHWGLCMAVPDGGEHLLTSFFFRPWEFVHGRFCVSAAVGWQTRNAIRNLTWGLNEITTRCASIH